MKNWRTSIHDVSPPLHHDDPRQRWTKIGIGGFAVAIGPGPYLHREPSVYVTERTPT